MLLTPGGAADRATDEPLPDPAQLTQRIAEVLKDWRGLAAKHVQATCQLLLKLLHMREDSQH